MDGTADGKDQLATLKERKSKGEKKKKKSSSSSTPKSDLQADAPPDERKPSSSRPIDEIDSKGTENNIPSPSIRASGRRPDMPLAVNDPSPRNAPSGDAPILQMGSGSYGDRPSGAGSSRSSKSESNSASSTPRIQRETVSIAKPTSTKSAPIPIPEPVKKKIDDYDEDFEDYDDDDFEDEDGAGANKKSKTKSQPQPPIISPPKQSSSSTRNNSEEKSSKSSKNTSSTNDTSSSSSTSQATSKRGKKYASVNLSTAGDVSADPRAKRLFKLRKLNIFDLHEEKFVNQLNIPPGTQHDMYLRLIRSNNPPIKQIGIPLGDNTRETEMQTDDIVMVDKEMQFCYGDDTALWNIMRVAKSRIEEDKKSTSRSTSSRRSMTLLEEAFQHNKIYSNNNSNSNTNKIENTDQNNSSSVHLSSFLEKSSQLCISLLEEHKLRRDEIKNKNKNDTSNKSQSQIFATEHSWEFLADDLEANICITSRKTVALRYSTIQSQILMTAHAYPLDAQNEDLKPYTGLYCIWDTILTTKPSWILSGLGQPTSCCMSGTQTYVALAGTEEGVIHLWDMRENAANHQTKDSIDLRISKGIRKPCYSTPCMLDGMKDGDTGHQHCHPIVQVEPLGSSSFGTSVVSQFATIDKSGLTILWMTSEENLVSHVGGNMDFGLSPWSTLRLVRSRILRLDDMSMYMNASTSTIDNFSTGFQSVCPIFASISQDRSTFLLSSNHGIVGKLMRYGEAPNPKYFIATKTGTVEVQHEVHTTRSSPTRRPISLTNSTSTNGSGNGNSNQQGKREIYTDSYHSEVTSMSVSNTSTSTYLILVGRRNGIVDLFQCDETAPIQSWNMNAYNNNNNDNSEGKTNNNNNNDSKLNAASIVMIRWIPQKVSAFLVVDDKGKISYFNLIKNAQKPILVDQITIDHITTNTIDLSYCRPGSMSLQIAIADSFIETGNKAICLRKLWSGLMAQDGISLAHEERELNESMSNWVGRNVSSQVVQVFKIDSNMNRK
eukprot:gene7201-14683_t